MEIKSLHHVAYRCKDAKKTADFYTKVLDLEYYMAISEDHVPSTGEDHPYMHIFFRMDDGSCVAFFELPESPEMGRDQNTPLWVQHLALRVKDMKTLMRYKKRIESHGVEVLGPVDHTICQSIYFFDPNGIRLEACCQPAAAERPRVIGSVRQRRDDARRELESIEPAWAAATIAAGRFT